MIIFISKIIKELAQEFSMPEMIEKRLAKHIFVLTGSNEKTKLEKNEHGTDND